MIQIKNIALFLGKFRPFKFNPNNSSTTQSYYQL